MGEYVKLLINEYGTFASRLKVDSFLHTKIDLDVAVNELEATRQLSAEELSVLNAYSLGHTISSGSASIHMSRWRFRKLLSTACDKIETRLGWEYSDLRILQRGS